MIEPIDHISEKERLRLLDSYSILDTLPEKDYDDLTTLAAQICGTHISLVSLLDDKRQWFKSHFGLGATETPKEYAFCAHAINDEDEIFIIPDARKDERFHDNPLVSGEPHVIFYAGVPLKNKEGLPLGTLCVIDDKPKNLTNDQIKSLKALSHQVMNLLDLRKSKSGLETSLENIKCKNQALEKFALVAAHDIKSPLNNIVSLSSLYLKENEKNLDGDQKETIELINECGEKLKTLVDELFDYSCSEKKLEEEKSNINLNLFMQEVEILLKSYGAYTLTLKTEIEEIFINKTAFEQIVINLISNAIKYNDKEIAEIEFGAFEKDKEYEFYVKDNGRGIPIQSYEKIFELFYVLSVKDKDGNFGTGIGLATVKRIVNALGGTITVDSEMGIETTFTFTCKK